MSRLPLVLAIEPDLRQAAIVKRVVKERVQAEVVVVDSRDAALAAIRSAIPDVLLVSALLSPRDEDDVVSHLRTLEGASHLQTHTIPQLASALGRGEDGGGGLFSSFRRKKQSASAPSGCDPDMFADEIRVYLQRAEQKKREAAETGTVAPLPSIVRKSADAPAPVAEEAAPVRESSWASPFEWRPSQARTAPPPEPAPAPIEPAFSAESVIPELEPLVEDLPPLPPILDPEPAVVVPPAVVAERPAPKVHTPAPMSVWARKETRVADAAVSVDELNGLFARLGVPDSVASIGYADGVRIRRVRVRPAKESHATLHNAVLLGKKMLAELSGTDINA